MKLVDENADPSVLALYLNIARSKILERLYPIGDKERDEYELPSFYDMLQIQIAQYYYNNAGGVIPDAEAKKILAHFRTSLVPIESMLKGWKELTGK